MELPETYVPGFHDEEAVRKMTYIPFGKTGLTFSKLGFGGAVLGNVYGTINEEDGISVLREAITKGVNYIDTSPYYGNTKAETVLGKALAGIPRQAYYVSTKVGRYGPTFADMFDHSAEKITSEFENSLKRLGLDYVDIVFVHDIEFSPLQKILNESIPAARKLVDAKKAKLLGISAYPVSVLWEAIEKSTVKIDVVLAYSRDVIFDSTLRSYIPFFQSKGIGMICASLTGMGLLTNAGPQPWHPALPEIKQLCREAGEYCKERNVEFGKLAVYHGMSQPACHSFLVGITSHSYLNINLSVVYNGLTEHEKQVLLEVKEKFFNSGENYHWEGVELKQYQDYLNKNQKSWS